MLTNGLQSAGVAGRVATAATERDQVLPQAGERSVPIADGGLPVEPHGRILRAVAPIEQPAEIGREGQQ